MTMAVAAPPLTWANAAGSWTFDAVSVVLICAAALLYAWACRRRGEAVRPARRWCFGSGLVVWALATFSVVAVYAGVLFWMRALQVVLLLMVVPFLLALGQPLTVLRAALDERGRQRMDRLIASPAARVIAHPLTTSVAMLATPWLLYLTPWYVASLRSASLGALTRVFLVAVGFGYFYARLQADPVPRRYSQLMSLLISVGESIGDGLLGLVLWLGPLVGSEYYLSLHRDWGPSPRMDQVLGAGMLWILGDVLGVPFVMVLMRALGRDERVRAAAVDDDLDRGADVQPDQGDSTLWWLQDPQLRERFDRR